MCPKVECPYTKYLREGEKCPLCGSEAQQYGFRERVHLHEEKSKHQKTISTASQPQPHALISEKMSDEELQNKIAEDMQNLARHEAGSGLMQLGTLLGGTRTEQILAAGFKALIDENKIIIRQNELLLRSIKKQLEAKSPEGA